VRETKKSNSIFTARVGDSPVQSLRYHEIVGENKRDRDESLFWDGNCMPISRDNYECSQVKTVSLRVPSIDSLSKRLSYHSSINFPFASTVLFPDNGADYLFRYLLDPKGTFDLEIYLTMINNFDTPHAKRSKMKFENGIIILYLSALYAIYNLYYLSWNTYMYVYIYGVYKVNIRCSKKKSIIFAWNWMEK